MGRGRPVTDLTGNRYGRLIVISRAGTYGNGSATWLVHCDCGKSRIVANQALTLRRTQSCGCLRADLASQRIKAQQLARERWRGKPVTTEHEPEMAALIAAAQEALARRWAA